jgi:hypothetical protein
MAVYFLNVSVDVVAPSGGPLHEDTQHNMQESVIELLLEKYMNLGNVVDETQDESNNEHRNWSSKKLDVFRYFNQVQYSVGIKMIAPSAYFPDNAGKCLAGYGSICNPPPEPVLA